MHDLPHIYQVFSHICILELENFLLCAEDGTFVNHNSIRTDALRMLREKTKMMMKIKKFLIEFG